MGDEPHTPSQSEQEGEESQEEDGPCQMNCFDLE